MQSAQREQYAGSPRFSARKTLKKQERLTGVKAIDALFNNGVSRSAVAFPLRVVYQLTEGNPSVSPVQMLVSVPKKRFKHAVDRNRVKRQVREAYRQHKQLLDEALPADKRLLLAFIWLSDSHLPSCEVEHRVSNLLRRIAEKQ